MYYFILKTHQNAFGTQAIPEPTGGSYGAPQILRCIRESDKEGGEWTVRKGGSKRKGGRGRTEEGKRGLS